MSSPFRHTCIGNFRNSSFSKMINCETGNVILKEYSPNGSLRPVISPRESRGRKRKHGARKYEDFSHPSHFHSIPLMSSFPQDEGSLSLSWEAGPLQDVSQCFFAKLFGEAFPQKNEFNPDIRPRGEERGIK